MTVRTAGRKTATYRFWVLISVLLTVCTLITAGVYGYKTWVVGESIGITMTVPTNGTPQRVTLTGADFAKNSTTRVAIVVRNTSSHAQSITFQVDGPPTPGRQVTLTTQITDAHSTTEALDRTGSLDALTVTGVSIAAKTSMTVTVELDVDYAHITDALPDGATVLVSASTD